MNEKTFSPKTNQQYVLVKADLLLKQKHYKEALPYLETALKNAPKREQARISFIYAQVLERLGLYADAYEKYAYTIKKNPSLEMEFNAFLNKTRCYQGSNKDAVKKDMAKLMKKQSNAPYLENLILLVSFMHVVAMKRRQLSFIKLQLIPVLEMVLIRQKRYWL